jgi:DNA-binding PadR family transcriptional regulator
MKQPGMLELPVLGLLKERDMHGYELRKQLGGMLGPFWQVSWGSLYPTLRRLAKADAVAKTAEPAPRRRAGRAARSSALPTGRRKTVYRITEHGEQMFHEMLEEVSAAIDSEHFTLKVAFFRYLKPELRLIVLERRRAYLQESLERIKANLREYRERLDSYALMLQDHDISSTERDIRWIDELISQERGLDIPRPHTTP